MACHKHTLCRDVLCWNARMLVLPTTKQNQLHAQAHWQCSARVCASLTEQTTHCLWCCSAGHVFLAQNVAMPETHSVIMRVSNLQGNMDPGVLFGSKETIAQRVVDTVRSAEGTRHVMNLGHGVLVGTPEENVAHFFEVGKSVHERL